MILRRFLGTLAGLVAGIATIAASEALLHLALGTATPAEATDAMRAGVLLAWFVGALVGGLVAALLARWRVAPWIVGGLVAVSVLMNATMLPQPVWMSAAGVVLALLAAWIAARRVPAADQRVAL